MRLRSFHLLIILIAFILIKNRFVVFAGRKYFLKKLLKGAVLASLIRPNYIPIPVPVPMPHGSHHHLNTPVPFPLPNLMHQPAWPASRHLVHHLPELPLNNHLSWGGWSSNELQASMRSPIVTQAPNHQTNTITNQLTTNIPFGLPFNQENSLLNNKINNDALTNLPLDLFNHQSSNDPLDLLSARASNQISNYSFRKWFGKKEDSKKKLI